MLGCVYLILAALLGREIIRNFLPEQRMREKGITPLMGDFCSVIWKWCAAYDLGCLYSSMAAKRVL